MGKLHTLRRAIERDPDAWQRYKRPSGAHYWRGGWSPSPWSQSYRAFVAHVLDEIKHREVGNADVERGRKDGGP